MSGPWACRSLLLSHSWYPWCHCFIRNCLPLTAGAPHFIALHFILLQRYYVFSLSHFFNKVKIWGSPVLNNSIGTIFPAAFAHIFHTFHYCICYDNLWSVWLAEGSEEDYHFFSNKVFLMEACTLFFRQNAIAYLTDCSREETTFTCTGKQTNQKICDSLYYDIHLIVVIWT